MPHPAPAALLSAALVIAARGWPVFPLKPGGKRPAITAWEQRATTDPARIQRCWTHAPYSIGVATGPARLLVIDLDTPKDAGDKPTLPWSERAVRDGADVLAWLAGAHGQPYPADTFTVRTGRGGAHLYFSPAGNTAFRNTAGDSARGLGWKVDTRAAGGYAVGPGSVVNSRPYTAICGAAAAPLPLARRPPHAPAAAPSAAREGRAGRHRAARQVAARRRRW